jgi:hypothetical protein
MTPSTKRVSSLLVPAAVALMAIAAAEANGVLVAPPALRVESATADGRGARVAVANPAPVSRSGILTILVQAGDREITLTVPVVVPAGATAVVEVPLPFSCTLLDAGIVLDDGSPL